MPRINSKPLPPTKTMGLACFQEGHRFAGIYFDRHKGEIDRIAPTMAEIQGRDPAPRFPYPKEGKPWSKEEFVAFVVQHSDDPTPENFMFNDGNWMENLGNGIMNWTQLWGKELQYFEQLTLMQDGYFTWHYSDEEGRMARTDQCIHMAMTGDPAPSWPLMDSPYRPANGYLAFAETAVRWHEAILLGNDEAAMAAVQECANLILPNPTGDDMTAIQAILYRIGERLTPCKADPIYWRQVLARRVAMDLFGPEKILDVRECYSSLFSSTAAA